MKTDGKGCPGEEVKMKEKSFDPILKSIFRALRMAAVLCAAVFLLHCLQLFSLSAEAAEQTAKHNMDAKLKEILEACCK